MELIYWSILAGILGGIVRATLGYLNRPEDEPFRPKAFIRSIIIALLAGAFIAFNLKTGPIETFFSAVGTDWLLKEGYDALRG